MYFIGYTAFAIVVIAAFYDWILVFVNSFDTDTTGARAELIQNSGRVAQGCAKLRLRVVPNPCRWL
jgi:hypothetical protein